MRAFLSKRDQELVELDSGRTPGRGIPRIEKSNEGQNSPQSVDPSKPPKSNTLFSGFSGFSLKHFPVIKSGIYGKEAVSNRADRQLNIICFVCNVRVIRGCLTGPARRIRERR